MTGYATRTRLVPFGLGVALFLLSPAAPASEISIENTAIEKLLLDQVYIDKGRYHLVPETRCQYGYLTSPSVSISQGRVRLKSRLTGRLGFEVGGQCSGLSDAFDVTVSGQPYFSGERLGLKDVRIDEVSNPLYKPMLQVLAAEALPRAIDINLRQGVQSVLAGQRSPYDVAVGRLSVTELTAENNRLFARLDFAVSAR
jgi:hypothetical protein